MPPFLEPPKWFPHLLLMLVLIGKSKKKIQNDSKSSKLIQTNSNWFKLIQTDPNWFEIIKTDSNWFKLIQTDSKWLKMIQNDSCGAVYSNSDFQFWIFTPFEEMRNFPRSLVVLMSEVWWPSLKKVFLSLTQFHVYFTQSFLSPFWTRIVSEILHSHHHHSHLRT